MLEVFKRIEQRQIPAQVIQAPGDLVNAAYRVGEETGESFLAMCYQLPLNPQHPLLTSYARMQNIPEASFLLQFGALPDDKMPLVIMKVGILRHAIALRTLGIDATPPLNYSIRFDADPAKQIIKMEIPAHDIASNLLPLETLFA